MLSTFGVISCEIYYACSSEDNIMNVVKTIKNSRVILVSDKSYYVKVSPYQVTFKQKIFIQINIFVNDKMEIQT